jgi:hypothetical protein
MKLTERIKALLPVSRKQYEADIAAEKESKRKALQFQESNLRKKEAEIAATLDDLMAKLSHITWTPDNEYCYVMQMRISDEMLRHVHDSAGRDMVANALGGRLAAEIRASKFIEGRGTPRRYPAMPPSPRDYWEAITAK